MSTPLSVLASASRRTALLMLGAMLATSAIAETSLLNVSYDVTREFYKDYNAAFSTYWQKQAGEAIAIKQSHGGSSKQARSVVDGLAADVITMNQANDIDILATQGKLIPADWAKRLPNDSAPTTSVTVILVRKGNPKGIKDWADLARPGVSVVIPNPKTSGNGRYTYLAAWGSVIQAGGTADQARKLVKDIFGNVPVFDGGGRAATTTFAQRNIGDALATFESEVPLIQNEFNGDYEVVYPRRTVLAENPVAVVDRNVDKAGTRKAAEAYLRHLWSDEGQTIAARHHLRPRSDKVLAQFQKDFPKVSTFTVTEVFGGWQRAQTEHFNDGGIYDQLVVPGARK
jgi:sulfate transport system substrate-binding protein